MCFFLVCFGGGIRPRFVLVWNGWFVVIRNALMTELGWSPGPCRTAAAQTISRTLIEINGILLCIWEIHVSHIHQQHWYFFCRPQCCGEASHHLRPSLSDCAVGSSFRELMYHGTCKRDLFWTSSWLKLHCFTASSLFHKLILIFLT